MDIVEWLRTYGSEPSRLNEAADTIEQLREYNDSIETRYWEFAPKYDSLLIENKRLREALQKIYWATKEPEIDRIAGAALQQKDTE